MTTASQKGLAAARTRPRQRRRHHLERGAYRSRRHDPGRRQGRQYLRRERAASASAISRRACSTAAPAQRTSDQIAEALDERGVSLTVGANRHVMTVSCTCLSEDFEAMLDLVGEIVMQPAFPDQEIEKRKGEVLNAIRQDEDNPAAMAMLALFAMLYPDQHPYGRPSKGTRRQRQPDRAPRSDRLSRRRDLRRRRRRRSSWEMSIARGPWRPASVSSARGARPRRLRLRCPIRRARSHAPGARDPDDEQGAGRHRATASRPSSAAIRGTTRTR